MQKFHENVPQGDEEGFMVDLTAVIPFSHRLLVGKQIVSQEKHQPPRGGVARAYHQLANAIIKANYANDAEGARAVLYNIHAKRDAINTGAPRSVLQPTRLPDAVELEQIQKAFRQDASIQAQVACCFFASQQFPEAFYAMDCAVDAQRDWPKLRWQRASYQRRRGSLTESVQDLLWLLNLPDPPRSGRIGSIEDLDWRRKPSFDLPSDFQDGTNGSNRTLPDYSDPLMELAGVSSYYVSALWTLRELDEHQYEQVTRKPCFTNLSPMRQKRLLAGPGHVAREKDPFVLIREKKWKEALEHLETCVSPSSTDWTLEDAFHLFIALWASGKEESLGVYGNKAIIRFSEILKNPRLFDLRPSHLQMMSLAYWKTGDSIESQKCLKKVIDEGTRPDGQLIFSYWHYEFVSWDQFQKDCHAQWLMIRGANWLPPVLGKSPAPQ